MLFALVLAAVTVSHAAERHWQTGHWTDVRVKRQTMDFGPGGGRSTPYGGGSSAPQMRAMADVRIYVIETDTLRLELEDVVQVDKRSIDAVVGLPVTFALEKNSVYIRDSDGIEHKVKVTKKINKPTSQSSMQWIVDAPRCDTRA